MDIKTSLLVIMTLFKFQIHLHIIKAHQKNSIKFVERPFIVFVLILFSKSFSADQGNCPLHWLLLIFNTEIIFES